MMWRSSALLASMAAAACASASGGLDPGLPAAVAVAAKPSAHFAMRLTPDAAIASASTPATARLVVQSLVPGSVNFEVALEATGRVVLAQPADLRFTVTAAAPTREVPIEYGA